MNTLFANPIVKKFITLKKTNPTASEAEEKWTEKAIKSLVKKLKRAGPNVLEDLERALSTQDRSCKCVLIARFVGITPEDVFSDLFIATNVFEQ